MGELLPRLIPEHTFKIYPHEGKGRLANDPTARPESTRRGVLDQLPAKLRAFHRTLNSSTDRVVVLVDLDEDDCVRLLDKLNGLRHQMETPEYIARIAIEEVEAWYLGDWEALRREFPSAKKVIYKQYEQDTICGTWEKLQEVIDDPMERKTYWAQKMGAALDVDGRNRSDSFNRFCKAVKALAGDPPVRSTLHTGSDEPRPRRRAVRDQKTIGRASRRSRS